MAEPQDPTSRQDAVQSTRRDLERLARREPERDFWKHLGVVGGVGGPIVLLAIGGAALGRMLDTRWDTGVRLTFSLLTFGAAFGSWLAWRTIRGGGA